MARRNQSERSVRCRGPGIWRVSSERRDLILLVADKNIEHAVKGLLSRPEALGIHPIASDVIPHPERDPGCLLRAPEFLRSFRQRYRHALVLLDREGSGRDETSRLELEADLEKRLSGDWVQRSAAVVLDPELEAWIWSDSPHVESVLGWQGRTPDLRSWLVESGFCKEKVAKPARPKEAMEKALRLAGKPRSSALYLQLAREVSFQRCLDPAFGKFKQTLQSWFPITTEPPSNS